MFENDTKCFESENPLLNLDLIAYRSTRDETTLYFSSLLNQRPLLEIITYSDRRYGLGFD